MATVGVCVTDGIEDVSVLSAEDGRLVPSVATATAQVVSPQSMAVVTTDEETTAIEGAQTIAVLMVVLVVSTNTTAARAIAMTVSLIAMKAIALAVTTAAIVDVRRIPV